MEIVKELTEEVAITRTSDLREQLKRMFAQEIAKIPDYLQEMEPGARVAALCKMMPYIFPPLEKCGYWVGEKSGFAAWDEM